MGSNLWDLVQQIADPDGWRERKVGQLRQQWGYDATSPLQSQGDPQYKNQIYSDSFPTPLEPRDLSTLHSYEQSDLWKNIMQRDKMKGAPMWFPERYDLNNGIKSSYEDLKKKNKQPL